jgi:hypothetical protein
MKCASTLVLSLSMIVVAWAAPPEDGPAAPDESEMVSRAIQVVGGMLHRLPDYTCLVTLERSERKPHGTKFHMLDRVRVEVAYVNGAELYAWPGSTKFEEMDLRKAIPGKGAFSTGNFGERLMNAYLMGLPLQFAGRDTVKGQVAWKFTQSIPAVISRFDIIVPPARATAGYNVTAWHDAANLELLRFELLADDLPKEFPLRRSFEAVEYEAVQVNGQPVRLPVMTELSMTTRGGVEDRTVSTFSNCREYKSESKLTFEEPAPVQANPAPQAASTADLPAGVEVQVKLDAAVDLRTAALGDPVTMTVSRDVIVKGRKALSQGAHVTSRWKLIECKDEPFAYCFAILEAESFEDGSRSGRFRGSLVSPSMEPRLWPSSSGLDPIRRVPVPDGILRAGKDAPVLYAPITTKLPRGYQLIWRTLEVSRGTKP